MHKYPKINTIFKRNEKTKQIIEGDFSLPEFEFLKDNGWVFTEKVDGTNTRVIWNGESVSFGGKTDEAQIPAPLLSKLEEKFIGAAQGRLFKEIFADNTEVCLYGEGYGQKIGENGHLYLAHDNDFVLFDVLISGWWLERHNVEDIAQRLGIKCVPLIGNGTLNTAVAMAKEGFQSQWGDFLAEGIVARPRVELKTRKGERIITKIKYRDFK